MRTGKPTMTFGWRVYAVGVMMVAALCLAWGVFDPGQPVPKDLPGYTVLAYAAAAYMFAACVAIEWRRTAAWGAAALTGYYALVVVVLMNGSMLLAHHDRFGPYESVAEQVAITAAGLIVYATTAKLDAAIAGRLTRLGQLMFGACALVFGAAHFFYPHYTASLVPRWLTPSQLFWAYATGAFHVAAGVAILTGVRARLAAILLAIMYASFTPLVHVPLLLGDPSRHFFWTENAVNIALTGAAWVVADSLVRSKRPRGLKTRSVVAGSRS